MPPSSLRLTLPHGRGHLDAGYNAVVPCVAPGSPTTIGSCLFRSSSGTERPGTAPPCRRPCPGPTLHGRRGGMLRFRVVLKNVSQTTARFDRCPAYVEQLAPAGTVQVYDLNCAAAHPIAPGRSLAFSIQLRVPEKAPIGPNGRSGRSTPSAPRLPRCTGAS